MMKIPVEASQYIRYSLVSLDLCHQLYMNESGSEKKKVLLFTPEFGRFSRTSGVGVSAERVVGYLSEHFDVIVVSGESELPPFRVEATDHGSVTRVFFGRHSDEPEWRRALHDFVLSLLRRGSVHSVVSFYVTPDSYPVMIASQKAGVPFYAFCRGNDVTIDIFGEGAFHVRETLKGASRVFCVSREMCVDVDTLLGEKRSCYIPNGVNTEVFSPRDLPEKQQGSSVVIGLFGDIKLKKGLSVLLEGIDFSRYRLRVIGSLREDQQKLLHGFVSLHHDYLRQIEVVSKVTTVAELCQHYQAVDVVCIPSLHEGMPNVLLEAMAMGKPVIAARVGGIPDVLEQGRSGFLFERGDVVGLRDALNDFHAMTEEARVAMGEEGRRRVVGSFSVECERRRVLGEMLR